MNKKQLAEIRLHLEKTQSQMAQILGVSPKAIQSFEQGWRNIPVHVERQVLLILALENHVTKRLGPAGNAFRSAQSSCERQTHTA